MPTSPATVVRLLSGIAHWRIGSDATVRSANLDPGRNHPEDPDRPDPGYDAERADRLIEIKAHLPEDWTARWDGSVLVAESMA